MEIYVLEFGDALLSARTELSAKVLLTDEYPTLGEYWF